MTALEIILLCLCAFFLTMTLILWAKCVDYDNAFKYMEQAINALQKKLDERNNK